MSAESAAAAKQNFPNLAELTTMFMEQDWADSVYGSEHMLAIEVVGHMFRESVDEWLADPAISAAVQTEIAQLLAVTSDPGDTEIMLGVELPMYEHFGINIRAILNNTRTLLMGNGSIGY